MFYALPSVGCQNGHAVCKTMNSREEKTSLRLQTVRFPLTFCHNLQRMPVKPGVIHPPRDTQLLGFVWRSNGSGPRNSVCASLVFSNPGMWESRISPNERDAEPTDLQQLDVELFLIRVDGPSGSQQLHRIRLPHDHTSSSGPEFPSFWTMLSQTDHCGLSRGDTSSTICVAKHINIGVQFSPWVSASPYVDT